MPLLIPVFAFSFFIPAIAWRLQNRSWISLTMQRRVEKLWLTLFTILAIPAWALWAIDFYSRIAEAGSDPLMFGYMVIIVLVSLWCSAIRHWRKGECLTGHSLFKCVVFIVLQNVAFFVLWFVITLLVIVFSYGRLPGLYGPPEWTTLVGLAISIAVHILANVIWKKRKWVADNLLDG